MPPPNLIDATAGSPTRLPWQLGVDAWIKYLNGQIGSIPTTVVNGDFEQYTGTNNVPDNWVFTPFTGGAGALDNTTSSSGLYSFKITCLGGGGSNGGGQLDSYVSGTGGILVPFNPEEDFWASWYYITNLATLSDKVEVLWYQGNGSASAITPKQTLWSAASGQPTSSFQQNVGFIANTLSGAGTVIPADARFYSLRFTGGVAGAAAGSVWYDNVKSGFVPKIQGVSQVFPSSGSFTPPSNCFRILVKLWGGGGSGGPGAGGGYCEGFLNVVPGVPVTVTVGAAEADSVVSALTAHGAIGATPGSASGGFLNVSGSSGVDLSASAAVRIGGSSPQGGQMAVKSGGGSLAGNFPGGGSPSGTGAAGQVIIIY